jgi:esterase
MAPNIAAFPTTHHLIANQGDTLFIAGADSAYVTQDDTSTLFPNAIFKTIVKAGHWLHVQQPEVFAEVVEKFLQSES